MEIISEQAKGKENKAQGFFYGWVIVASALLVAIVAYAVHYSFGVFFKPLAAEFGWTRAMTSGAFSLYMISRGAFGILTGWAADKYGPRITVAAGGFFIAAGLLLTSQISSIWQLYLAYGVLVGLGVSVAFAPLVSVVARWFTKRRGLATGIVLAGIGLGTAIMPQPADYLIGAYGWSTSYIIMAIVALVIIVPNALLLRRDPQQMGLSPYGKPVTVKAEATISGVEAKKGFSLPEALKTRPFWVLMVMTTLFAICLYMVMIHIVPYATDMRIPRPIAVSLLTIVGLTSIIGRAAGGSLADRLGSKLALAIFLTSLAIVLFWLAGARELWMLYTIAAIFGFTYGGCVPQMPLLAAQLFGLQSMGAIVGVEMLGTSLGGAIGPLLGGYVFDSTGSYRIAFLAGAIGLLIAVALIPLLKAAKRAS